jgi:hypothetical protein
MNFPGHLAEWSNASVIALIIKGAVSNPVVTILIVLVHLYSQFIRSLLYYLIIPS